MRRRFDSLGGFLVSVMLAACVDALGTSAPSAELASQVHDSVAVGPTDSVPRDTVPPPPPPDTGGSAVIHGLVIGIDSTTNPPTIGPVAKAAVTLFAILRSDSSASGARDRLDSLRVTIADSAGSFWFTGIRARQYALRAIAPSGLRFRTGGTLARGVVVDDSTRAPLTYLYLHRVER